ncbi:hypothetical protein UO65_1182 [Actinokineospora spheciospongiae]|uniref:AAA+ ATPase domain-containing protein n=1 Tax=Actinokineospora spheciospongiae TaxID=909613 RepID=W7IR82_9PSEU|nr:ATP-binding protein [Actinokineospora spheciospongiae]EWC63505.1 hypothetical protein UO65_1182 [Actinokineospora spheciospongiae]
MRRDPPITFRGALQILGHHDRPWLTRLNGLLGGVVLAAGGIPPITALFGWVDQKNEATALTRQALDAVSDRLTRTGGLDRHQLVIAAHTTIATAAVFDTVHAAYPESNLTDPEKLGILTANWADKGESLVRALYAADVPTPSLVRGFHENTAVVRSWAMSLLNEVFHFLDGLDLDASPRQIPQLLALVESAYRDSYLILAATVPEFKVWSDLGEHAATRSALARLESLLTTPVAAQPRDLRDTVRAINRAELDRPIIDVDTDGYGTDAVFPAVSDIFITPRFRAWYASRGSRLGDEQWWQEISLGEDLDLVLARHFLTGEATKRPLLLLGHPGAGKSLLTKVLAARLPDSTYTVIRVPLRRVDADAHIADQIREALAQSTHGRVDWSALADQSADTVRVVLLDGLDELLQATTNDRGGYLTDVVEFQRREAAMGRPVAVVVTSRTLVAERVRLPDATPVVKLEEFDDAQIDRWVSAWNQHNTRPMDAETAKAQGELARQPLLLLMLTLYFTDPAVGPVEDLSESELYGRLFDTYARREVTKQAGRVLPDAEFEEAVETQLTRLSVAALGMFNRGRQSITEAELTADLLALGEQVPDGGKLLGEFFFVHSAEATTGTVHRSYEFLHATFNEYLVAARVVDVLRDLAEGTFARRKRRHPDDDLLFTLLSYQPLTTQRPVLAFITQLFDTLGDEANDIAAALDLLLPTHRPPGNRHPEYRPLPADHIRASAAYSANLFLLRATIAPIDPETVWPQDETDSRWIALADLWAAGLDSDGYRSLFGVFNFAGGKIRSSPGASTTGLDLLDAQHLRGRRAVLEQFSVAVVLDRHYSGFGRGNDWAVHCSGWLTALLVQPDSLAYGFLTPPDWIEVQEMAEVANLAYGVLAVRCGDWEPKFVERYLRWLLRLPLLNPPSPLPMMLAYHHYREVFDRLLSEVENDRTPYWAELLRTLTPERLADFPVGTIADYLGSVDIRLPKF